MDYSTPGVYFTTIVTKGRQCLFGDVVGEEVALNDAGEMVTRWWRELPRKFNALRLDEFVVMSNHVHGLIWIDDVAVGTTVSDVIGWFKTMTTNDYIRGVKDRGWMRFEGSLWQRSFYDRFVRDDDDLRRIQQYIIDNPRLWAEDEENPGR